MMKTVIDFYNKYKINEFYTWQKENSNQPIEPFKKEKHKSFSFGILPGYKKYDLFYERYLSAVNILKKEGSIKDGIRVLDVEKHILNSFSIKCAKKKLNGMG